MSHLASTLRMSHSGDLHQAIIELSSYLTTPILIDGIIRTIIQEPVMAALGKRWTIRDRDGNPIYLTEERWHHITEPNGHPEVAEFEEALKPSPSEKKTTTGTAQSAQVSICLSC